MFDDRGRDLSEAGPSTPVEILGLWTCPQAGDRFAVAPDEKTARAGARAAAIRQAKPRRRSAAAIGADARGAVDARPQAGEHQGAERDRQGRRAGLARRDPPSSSAQARPTSARQGAAGRRPATINESDVILAIASHALIVGFNVRRAGRATRRRRERASTSAATDHLRARRTTSRRRCAAWLEPKYQEVARGHAEVRQIFRRRRKRVRSPAVRHRRHDHPQTRQGCCAAARSCRGRPARVSLKRFKDDVREVAAGYECGITARRIQRLPGRRRHRGLRPRADRVVVDGSTRRVERINELLRDELSELIGRELKDPRLAGLISITEVETTSDLRHTKVFVSSSAATRSDSRAWPRWQRGRLPAPRGRAADRDPPHAELEFRSTPRSSTATASCGSCRQVAERTPPGAGQAARPRARHPAGRTGGRTPVR